MSDELAAGGPMPKTAFLITSDRFGWSDIRQTLAA